jgi:23S rRNA A2030 N6-methylase RlmJ
MIIINPPWQLDKTLQEVLPWLGHVLAIDGENVSHRVEWLVTE